MCVLTALRALHAHDFVRRDIKWANIIRHCSYHPTTRAPVALTVLLIGFECSEISSAPLDMEGRWLLRRDVLLGPGGEYENHHDLHFVGLLILDWAAQTGAT